MRFLSLCLVFLALFVAKSSVDAASDVRQRFEGLVGKNILTAWLKIDREGESSLMRLEELELNSFCF